MDLNPPLPLQMPTCAQAAGVGIGNIPEVLFDMEDDIGEAATAAFLRRFAGLEISVPRKPAFEDGAEICTALAWINERFGAGNVMIPMGPASALAVARWNAFLLLREGKSLREVARRLGCVTRSVSRHKQKLVELKALPAHAGGK